MLTCRYRDDVPISQRIYPEHNPLNILVHQESYQWDATRFNDFIGMKFSITNVGDDLLQDVYVAFFVDGDAGKRTRANYWEDDMVGMASLPAVCTDFGAVRYDIAYTFDEDGDEGEADGYFGVMFLDHPTDGDGFAAPQEVRFATFEAFSEHESFARGGDPANDFERYELISSHRRDADADAPRDYRMLVAAGPFPLLLPDSTLVLHMAFVAGEGRNGLLANAANAQLAYNGTWINADGDPFTGIAGRETPVVGPGRVMVDSCRKQTRLEQGCDITERLSPVFANTVRVPPGETIYVNNDCMWECTARQACQYLESDSLKFRTGVRGRERQIHWRLNSPPPPPAMRVDDHAREGVVLYWDNISEVTPDGITGELDFEGYQVWRAENWTRPLGTSQATGPPRELWAGLFQADIHNGLSEDTGLAHLRYEPLEHLMTETDKRVQISFLVNYMTEHAEKEPPCPQGVSPEVCDTLKALARFELGREGGRRYYRYVDNTVHLGRPYFYSVIAFDRGSAITDSGTELFEGISGSPTVNFIFVEPKSAAQHPAFYDEDEVYVVPNPATTETMSGWALSPSEFDPSGVKIEFRNLPASQGVIRIYTIAGDLVEEIHFDAAAHGGTVEWDLVSRNGQSVTSGVYLYSIDYQNVDFARIVKKFTVIR
jgi:hypothetical protein